MATLLGGRDHADRLDRDLGEISGKEQDDLDHGTKERGDLKINEKGAGTGAGAGAGAGGTNSSSWSWRKLQLMSAQFAAHRALLRRAMERLSAAKMTTVTMRPDNQQLDNMVENMLDSQSVSQDHCPTELAQATRDLNTLHTNIQDLADQVNASEAQIQSTTDALTNVHDDMTRLNNDMDVQLSKCESQQQEARRMVDTLNQQIDSMRQLGQEGLDESFLDASKRVQPATLMSPAKALFGGLLQEASSRPPVANKQARARPRAVNRKPMSAADAKSKVAKTKHLAKNLAQCLQGVSAAGRAPAAALGQVSPRHYVPRSLATRGGAFSQAAQPTFCRNDTRIQIRLGGVLQVITPGRTLQNGDTASRACSDVNSQYTIGDIIMTCDNGYVDVDLRHCLIRNTTGNGPSHEQCENEREELHEAYEEVYKEIAEELGQFEEEAESTTCHDTAEQNHVQRIGPLQNQQDSLSQALTGHTTQLQSHRADLEDAAKTEDQLRAEIDDIADRCQTITEVSDDLDRVRDAIHILDLCPGMGHLDFTLPEFVGSWVVLDVSADLRDAEIDAEMYALCRGLASGNNVPRPAETSEIQQNAVEGAPNTNTASVPLMGTCPGCEGVADDQTGVTHPSGHARICWDPEATLDQNGRREDCNHGRKAIMCVMDRHQ
jgi:predicted  nucleic acid-binding Zn-ribbon protein